MLATLYHNLEFALLLLIEVRLQNNDGYTALIIATQYGFIDIIDILVQHEAALTHLYSNTLLIYAAMNSHENCMNHLLMNAKV